MRHPLIIGLIALAPLAASAQEATPEETATLTAVARCLLPGLPKDWNEAQVVVTLDSPGAASGEGRYLFSRQLSQAEQEPFTPCATMNPVRALIEMRSQQSAERRGWTGVRFVLHRDGKFDLTYHYPKKEP